jgi:hypothetical protein
MWEIAAMIFAGVIFIIALILFKYMHDLGQAVFQALQEIKLQIYNQATPDTKLKKDTVEALMLIHERLKTNEAGVFSMNKHLTDLEFQLLKPKEINLYTKEPLKILQVKEVKASTKVSKAAEAQIIARVREQMRELDQ